ncbi:MAG: hypothetical protein WCV41_04515 [Patescibacteria group bacterium]
MANVSAVTIGQQVRIRGKTTIEFFGIYTGQVKSVDENTETCLVHIPEGIPVSYGEEIHFVHQLTLKLDEVYN